MPRNTTIDTKPMRMLRYRNLRCLGFSILMIAFICIRFYYLSLQSDAIHSHSNIQFTIVLNTIEISFFAIWNVIEDRAVYLKKQTKMLSFEFKRLEMAIGYFPIRQTKWKTRFPPLILLTDLLDITSENRNVLIKILQIIAFWLFEQWILLELV